MTVAAPTVVDAARTGDDEQSLERSLADWRAEPADAAPDRASRRHAQVGSE